MAHQTICVTASDIILDLVIKRNEAEDIVSRIPLLVKRLCLFHFALEFFKCRIVPYHSLAVRWHHTYRLHAFFMEEL